MDYSRKERYHEDLDLTEWEVYIRRKEQKLCPGQEDQSSANLKEEIGVNSLTSSQEITWLRSESIRLKPSIKPDTRGG